MGKKRKKHRPQFKAKVADGASLPLVEAIATLMIALLIYVGTGQFGQEPMSVGSFVSFLAALGLLFPPVKRLVGVNQPLQRGLAGAESVFGMIDELPEQDDGTQSLDDVRGELVFENVSYRYPAAKENALDGVTFTIAAGSTAALVGPSGSGKTTIASLVPRFYEVGDGRILLDGVDIRELTLNNLRSHISYVGQEPVLFNDSVAANIAYGINGAVTREEIEGAARAAYALDFINELPDGFETVDGGRPGRRRRGLRRDGRPIARRWQRRPGARLGRP